MDRGSSVHCILIRVDEVVSQSSLTKMLRELIESHSLSSSSGTTGAGKEVLLVDLLPFTDVWFCTGVWSSPALAARDVLDDEAGTL